MLSKPPATPKARTTEIAITTTGMPVEIMPTERPSITSVAGPVFACSAIPRVGA